MSTLPPVTGNPYPNLDPAAINVDFIPPVPEKSQDITKDAPLKAQNQEQQPPDYEQLLQKYGPMLITLIQKKRDSWQQKRRGIVLTVVTNKEMLKGNHNIGFYPGTTDTFDAFQEFFNFTGKEDKVNADTSMDRRPHNFYQMLEAAHRAALSASVPKNRWLPANGDVLEDRETAKAASRIEEIIERANKIDCLLDSELLELYTGGAYFKYSRYVVDADRTGTHKETVLRMTATEIVPGRMQCFNCRAVTPLDEDTQLQPTECPVCGTPFGPDSYFPPHTEEIPITEEKADVPNGMVLQDVCGVLEIDADPDAMGLAETPLLDWSQEVSFGWLRMAFSKFWEKFKDGQNVAGQAANDQQERLFRDRNTASPNTAQYSSYSATLKPTYSRTWCQPMLFAELDDRAAAEDLIKNFPKGLMLAHVGDDPLMMRPAKLTDEWSWCGARRKCGLFPPPIGNPAVPVQQRINDCINKIDEYFDRLAFGILLALEPYIDTKAMNGKVMLPGLLNPVVLKRGSPVTNIANLIHQVRADIDHTIFTYVSGLKQDMDLLVGTPPQMFGAGTQQGVETKGGQQQQLSQGMMKLGLTWNLLRWEHAESAENAVKCAQANMTRDWQNVVTDETDEFRAEYVRLDEIKGSVHAMPETDQGFPMTWAEIKAWFQSIMQQGNEMMDFLAQEPENIDTMLRYIGIPGLVAPGATMRSKALQVIYKLVKGQPRELPDPTTGQVITMPSVEPDKYLDDLDAWVKFIPTWTQKHWDQIKDNDGAKQNLVAFYKQCIVMNKEKTIEMQLPAQQALPFPPNQAPNPALARSQGAI